MLLKRAFDLSFSVLLLFLIGWIISIFWIIAALDTNSSGIFMQDRIGQYGRLFKIFKLRSIHKNSGKISSFGKFIRNTKIDESPQLINVIKGEMSFVGPRPDIPGYYDRLAGKNLKILELKPGITSAASLKYSDEEALLNRQQDPLQYNDTVIFPDKVKMNLEYYYKRTFLLDLKIIMQTFFRFFISKPSVSKIINNE